MASLVRGSNRDAFDLVEGELVLPPVVELGRLFAHYGLPVAGGHRTSLRAEDGQIPKENGLILP